MLKFISLNKRVIINTIPNDKTIRLRYIRYLEKFHKRSVGLLKHNDFDIKIFQKNIYKYYDELKLIQSIRLNSPYLKLLEDYVNDTLNLVSNCNDDFMAQKDTLLHKSNQLQKEKNRSIYKKDKHIKKSFNDGY